MEEKILELRAYFFVPYNISEMQRGVQGIHAAFRYGRKFAEDEIFKNFVDNHETVIILNGGTTNDERDFEGFAAGTLNHIGDQLNDEGIPFTYFVEPDLNHALTALCFIADERIWNKEDYPDFIDYLTNSKDIVDESFTALITAPPEELKTIFPDKYKEWVRLIGGVKNIFLRELLKGKKLA
jgi:hypothetical protein